MPSFPDIVLLLTATIHPRDMVYLHRSDPEIRLADYKQSLKLWLANPKTPDIIFCENSGYDLSGLIAFCAENNPHHKNIEFISFNDNNYPREYGKGYGEIRIVEHVLSNSKLIKPDTLVIKATGRLYCAGIGNILRRIGTTQEADVYCNLTSCQSRAETYLFGCTVLFLKKYLLPMKEQVNDSEGVFFEHILASAVHKAIADGRRWSMIPGFIDLRGVSGTTGISYTRSLISRLKGRLFYRLKMFVLFRED